MRYTQEELEAEGRRQVERAKLWLLAACWIIILGSCGNLIGYP